MAKVSGPTGGITPPPTSSQTKSIDGLRQAFKENPKPATLNAYLQDPNCGLSEARKGFLKKIFNDSTTTLTTPIDRARFALQLAEQLPDGMEVTEKLVNYVKTEVPIPTETEITELLRGRSNSPDPLKASDLLDNLLLLQTPTPPVSDPSSPPVSRGDAQRAADQILGQSVEGGTPIDPLTAEITQYSTQLIQHIKNAKQNPTNCDTQFFTDLKEKYTSMITN